LPEVSPDQPDLSAWKELFVPDPILSGLRDLGFREPTPIQRETLPAAIKGRRDIVGAAETGSGSCPFHHFFSLVP
jgi:ATP-dependent RNA helicase DDX24/MAK5